MMDGWDDEVARSRARKELFRSFGPNARALLANTKHGLFAVDPEDTGVGAILLHEGCYVEDEFLLARSFLQRSGDALIVGAHIGAHAIPLSKHCRELIVIEANPNSYELLNVNLKLNGCCNTISYNIAANDVAGTIEFLANTSNSAGSKRKPIIDGRPYVYDNPDVLKIDAMPLDAFLGSRAFALILMDIEGSEIFALKGMQNILSKSDALSVEFLPHHLDSVAGVSVEEFLSTITPHFRWLYVPRTQAVFSKELINREVHRMYGAHEGHDGIYFVKDFASLPPGARRS